jgi:hypothetical protein
LNRLAAVALAAACGARPAEPLEPVTPVDHSSDIAPPRYVHAERPDVDLSAVLPDPGEDLRWPLAMSVHPVLEPHFAVAEALATPGVSWLDLCARGVHHRHLATGHELVEYLAAWCDVADHHSEAAVEKLVRLRSSTVLGMPAALPIDIASVLADLNDPGKARALIQREHIRDPETLDLLSATYYEIGHIDDALELNQMATDVDPTAPPAQRCHRLAKQIVLGPETKRRTWLLQLEQLGVPTDATCMALSEELRCWAGEACWPYFDSHHLPAGYGLLLSAYSMWPKELAGYKTYEQIASSAVAAMPVQGAEALAVAALGAALQTSECDGQRLTELAAIAVTMHAHRDPSLDSVLDSMSERIHTVRRMTRTECRGEWPSWLATRTGS